MLQQKDESSAKIRRKEWKNEFKEGLINDETFSDKELLFDDWEVRNPTFYSRERKEYVILLLWFSLCIIFAFVVSFFYVEVLLFLFLFIISFLVILFQLLRIKNCHIQIYKDRIFITNVFLRKRTIPYCFDKTSILIKHTFLQSPQGIVMVFIENEKTICIYKDFLNYASSYQEPKTKWEITIKEIGLKIIDHQEIIKND